MDEVSNMPLLDENKNSPIPELHKPEQKELSVSSLTTGSENIAPKIIFENPTSPTANISEVISKPSIQTKNNLNTLASEVEVSVAAPDMSTLHDVSNGSFLGDAGVSFKSCNDSFRGDVNNSFKSSNGSFVVETTSPKIQAENPLNDTITKTQSSLLQPNINVNHHKSEENPNLNVTLENTSSGLLTKDASFAKDQSTNFVKNILDSTVELHLPYSTDNTVQKTVGSTNSMLNNVSNLSSQSFSFGDSNMSNDSSLPNQQNKDASNVFNDSGLGGALAAFSSLKLDDSVAQPLKSHETSLDEIKDSHNSSNLMVFTTMIQDTSILDEVNCQVPIQVDSPAVVHYINKNIGSQISEIPGSLPEISDGALFDCLKSKSLMGNASPTGNMPKYLEGGICNDLFDLKGTEASPSKVESSGNVPETLEHAVCNDPLDLEGAEASSSKNKSSGNVPKALDDAVCSNPLDLKGAGTSPKAKSYGNTTEALNATCNEPIDLKGDKTETSLSNTELSGKVPEALVDAVYNEPFDLKATEAVSNPLKMEPSENVPEVKINVVCNGPIDFTSAGASPSKSKTCGNAPEASIDAICNEPFGLEVTQTVASPLKAEPSGKIYEDLDSTIFNNPFDLKGAKGETSPFENETFGDSLCDDPFNLKSFEAHSSPVDDFVFKVPENPTNVENEEFTDAVQFFKDPSSFQFLENIKTSSTEEYVPRSSLYIKFDPLHSFSNNPTGSDVLQALKNENLDANMQCFNVSPRESLGNILISFDSPRKSGGRSSTAPVIVAPAKVYTEEELHQLLNVNELTNQEILLKKQREMEEDLARKEKALMAKVKEKDAKIALLEKHIRCLEVVLHDLGDTSLSLEGKQKDRLKKTEALDEENTKLKGDVKTLTEDLQSVETTFSDFHKRYEQCKGMLKTFKENEELLKTQLNEQQQAYQVLQDSTREALEKAGSEVASVKKTSEAQTAVLKAQLKKAEMKISSLESDIKQIKIENSQLGGICDDLMEKVGKS